MREKRRRRRRVKIRVERVDRVGNDSKNVRRGDTLLMQLSPPTQ